jgi:osmotically-inducible protein OsmY
MVVIPTSLAREASPMVAVERVNTSPVELAASPLERAARERLGDSGYMALRDVACEIAAGEARLSGRLPSHYLKQVAQAAVAGLDGVRTVRNQIEVIPGPRHAVAIRVAVEGGRGVASRPGG